MASKEESSAVGDKHGRWTITKIAGYRSTPSGRSFKMLECTCDCGTIKEVYAFNVVHGRSVSCGCYMVEQTRKALTTHGHRIGGVDTPEYKAWCHMRDRVKSGSRNSKNYYQRGIVVCPRWDESFEMFLEDMGPRPAGKRSLDRINNDGNYEPGNCRWADYFEQANNKRDTIRLTFYGIERPLMEWSKISGVPDKSIRWRLSVGWPAKLAVWANKGTRLKDVLKYA